MKSSSTSFQLKPREEILEIIRETTVPHLPKFLGLCVCVAIPFFFLFPLFREGTMGIVIFFVLVAVTTLFLWRAIFCWMHTTLVVTDMRVIDIDQKGFFDRTVTEATYAQMDEVNYRVKGFFPTIFRYGTIRVHVRGTAADISFQSVSRPARVHDLLNDLREDHGKK